MGNETKGITVIDLFCGAGGFSEGFRQAGFDIVYGIDNWEPACKTHTINGLGETCKLDLLKIDFVGVLNIKNQLEDKYGVIDVIIGSPPCTEFSLAKNGGNGNIEKGMVLVRKYLLFIAIFKPKYWVMENVPRLESVLNKECNGSRTTGWTISYDKLGIPKEKYEELGIREELLHIPSGNVFISNDFGTCQERERFIAGKFPIGLMDKFKIKNKDVSLGNLIHRLKKSIKDSAKTGFIDDPNYPGYRIPKDHLKDCTQIIKVHPMHWEHMRHLKRRQIQYGKMSLPENMGKPARTIMATYNRSSRETLLFKTSKKIMYHGKKRTIFRQPTIREIACIQGFPLDFQLASKCMSGKYRLIGNAVPCQLSYAIAKTITYDININNEITYIDDFLDRVCVTTYRQIKNSNKPIIYGPKEIYNDVSNLRIEKEGLNKFKSDDNRHLKRKLLSSKLENDSFMVIFENTSISNGTIIGSNEWKICIQKGIGKKYYKIFLDEISIKYILDTLYNSSEALLTKAVLSKIIKELEKGIPLVPEKWDEFPGWSKCKTVDLTYFVDKRLKLPSITRFQETFTKDIRDIGDTISPIDIFDGIDFILLSMFKKNELCNRCNIKLLLREIKDKCCYPYSNDSRIIYQIEKVEIPLVTLIAALMSMHVLYLMYKQDYDLLEKSGYYSSIKIADNMLVNWCSYSLHSENEINKSKYLSL